MGSSQSQSERALVAWAVLGDTIKHADLYEGLFGFVRPIAHAKAGQRFVPFELCDALRDAYGLNMPVMVMESLAERLLNAGLLTVYTKTQAATIYTYSQSADELNGGVSREAISQMLAKFRDYIRSSHEKYASNADEALDNEFFKRLLHVDSLALLSRRDTPESLKRTANTITLRKLGEESSPSLGETSSLRSDEHLDYLFARFVLGVRDESPDTFNLLCDIASANLAAEALLTYREPPKRGDALQGLSIYLDAPLCMDILGVNIGREDYGLELTRVIKNTGVDICVFLHSINEVERVLEARCQSYLQATAAGSSVYSVEPPIIRDRVRAIVNHVEQTLIDRLGCRIVDATTSVPPMIRARIGASEENDIRTHLMSWSSSEGREVDVSSVCDLIRLRSTQEVPTRIISAGPTLVTRNTVLNRTANTAWSSWLVQSGRATNERIKKTAPLSISDRHLVGLIWITQGGGIGELSRELLVANCSSATAARRDVVVRVHNMLISTSPEDAKLFSAIIIDQRAERALMDATFGDPNVVGDDNVLDLLDRIKKATAAEVAEEKNAEISRIEAERDAAASALRERQVELESLRKEIELAQEHNEAQARYVLETDRKKIRDCFDRACVAYKWSGVMVGVFLTLIAYFLQVYLVGILNNVAPESMWSRIAGSWWIPFAAFALPTFCSVYEMPDMIFGSWRIKIANFVFGWLLWWHRVSGASNSATWDFRNKSLRFNELALGLGPAIEPSQVITGVEVDSNRN